MQDKGLIAIRVYNKHWEAERLVSIMHHWCPNDDIIVFCNYKSLLLQDKLQGLPCQLITVPSQGDSPYFNSGEPWQVGSIMLEVAVAQYALGKGYSFILSLNADEWLVTDVFKTHIQAIKNKQYQLIIPWVLHPNHKEDYYYVSIFIYDGSFDLFSNDSAIFDRYRKNIEYTFGRVIEERKKYWEGQGQRFEIKKLVRDFKYGYDAGFGVFQHCTSKNPANVKYYQPYFDEVNKVPVFMGDKTKTLSMGWKV